MFIPLSLPSCVFPKDYFEDFFLGGRAVSVGDYLVNTGYEVRAKGKIEKCFLGMYAYILYAGHEG